MPSKRRPVGGSLFRATVNIVRRGSAGAQGGTRGILGTAKNVRPSLVIRIRCPKEPRCKTGTGGRPPRKAAATKLNRGPGRGGVYRRGIFRGRNPPRKWCRPACATRGEKLLPSTSRDLR